MPLHVAGDSEECGVCRVYPALRPAFPPVMPDMHPHPHQLRPGPAQFENAVQKGKRTIRTLQLKKSSVTTHQQFHERPPQGPRSHASHTSPRPPTLALPVPRGTSHAPYPARGAAQGSRVTQQTLPWLQTFQALLKDASPCLDGMPWSPGSMPTCAKQEEPGGKRCEQVRDVTTTTTITWPWGGILRFLGRAITARLPPSRLPERTTIFSFATKQGGREGGCGACLNFRLRRPAEELPGTHQQEQQPAKSRRLPGAVGHQQVPAA